MNKKLIFYFLLGAIITSLCFYWYTSNKNKVQKITATEIDKLEGTDERIAASNITQYFPDDISILFSKYYSAYANSEYNYEKGLSISQSKTNFFEAVSARTGFYYYVRVKENEGAVFCQITNHYLPNAYLKQIVTKLIDEQHFILKESDTKYGHDFLIKEFPTYSIVVNIIPNSNQSYPSSLTIASYKK